MYTDSDVVVTLLLVNSSANARRQNNRMHSSCLWHVTRNRSNGSFVVLLVTAFGLHVAGQDMVLPSLKLV
jgi:hypothetical protein